MRRQNSRHQRHTRLTRDFGYDTESDTNRHEEILGVMNCLYFDFGGGYVTIFQDVYVHGSIHLKSKFYGILNYTLINLVQKSKNNTYLLNMIIRYIRAEFEFK